MINILPQRRVCKTPLSYTHILFSCIILCRNSSAFIDLVFRGEQRLHPVSTVIIDYANMNNSRNRSCNYGIFMIAEFQCYRTAHSDLSVIAFRIIQKMVLRIPICFSRWKYAGIFHKIADNVKAIDICLSRILERVNNAAPLVWVKMLILIIRINYRSFLFPAYRHRLNTRVFIVRR